MILKGGIGRLFKYHNKSQQMSSLMGTRDFGFDWSYGPTDVGSGWLHDQHACSWPHPGEDLSFLPRFFFFGAIEKLPLAREGGSN